MTPFGETIDVVAFDADDTLWHNEALYSMTQGRFKELLADYHDGEIVDKELYETEMRNLARYGYGIKSFTLSMIETALELTDGRIPGSQIRKIINFAHEMLRTPVSLLDGVERTIATIQNEYRLMIITKGDLFDQETKIAQSGLVDYFDHFEIVSDKQQGTYEALLRKYGVEPQRFMMVGNSLRSDVLPVVGAGGHGVFVPYHTTWAHEMVDEREVSHEPYIKLADIRELPELLDGTRESARERATRK